MSSLARKCDRQELLWEMLSKLIVTDSLLPSAFGTRNPICLQLHGTWKEEDFSCLQDVNTETGWEGRAQEPGPLLSLEAVSQMALPWTVWHLWFPVAAHRGQWWDPPQGRMQLTLVPNPITKGAFVRMKFPEDVFPPHVATSFDLWSSPKELGWKDCRVLSDYGYHNYSYFKSVHFQELS